MQLAAAELLGRDDLADRGLHQRRAAEEDRALVAHDHRLVAHRRHVRAAGRARAEHGGDLRDAGGRHPRLVVEDAPEVVAIREDLVLHRQERAAGVDEVDAGQPVLERDLLRAQVLLHGERVVRAALDGRVVADHHHVPPVHEPDARDDARRRAPLRRTVRRRRAGRSRGTDCPRRGAGRRGRAAAACRARHGARASRRDRRADAAASRSRRSAASAAWASRVRVNAHRGALECSRRRAAGSGHAPGRESSRTRRHGRAHVISVDVTIGSRRLSRRGRLVSVH